MAVSFQNEGEESIAEGSYKLKVSPGAHISEMWKKRFCPLDFALRCSPLPLAINGPLWWC